MYDNDVYIEITVSISFHITSLVFYTLQIWRWLRREPHPASQAAHHHKDESRQHTIGPCIDRHGTRQIWWITLESSGINWTHVAWYHDIGIILFQHWNHWYLYSLKLTKCGFVALWAPHITISPSFRPTPTNTATATLGHGLVGTAPGGRQGGEEEEVLELIIQGVTWSWMHRGIFQMAISLKPRYKLVA